MYAKTVYQTVEARETILTEPLWARFSTLNKELRFGEGYYFWEALGDAHRWGEVRVEKHSSYPYEIYEAYLECPAERCLDLLDEQTHSQWQKLYSEVLQRIRASTGTKKLTTENLNEFFWLTGAKLLFGSGPDLFWLVRFFEPKSRHEIKDSPWTGLERRIILCVFNLAIVARYESCYRNRIQS